MDRLGQEHGYLVLFEPKTTAEIAREDRLKWEDTTHNGKRVTVVGT